MRHEAKELLGRRDFRSFMAMDPAQKHSLKNKNTIRKIKRLDIKKRGEVIIIEIEADGFLYKMVR